jgi:hypothetical protein
MCSIEDAATGVLLLLLPLLVPPCNALLLR